MQALGASPKYLHTPQIQKPPNGGRTGVVTTLVKKMKPCQKVPQPLQAKFHGPRPIRI